MLDELRKYLEQYDRILWIEDVDGMPCSLTRAFCESDAIRNFAGSVLILSTKKTEISGQGFSYRILDTDEQEEIRKYYMMYEFSNRFSYFSQSALCGGLSNYIQTGWMSCEEVFEALLQ